MIYTSYYSKVKSIDDKTIPVSIALITPKWYNGLEYKTLSPTYGCLKDYKINEDIEIYEKRFYDEILNKLSIEEVIIDLEKLTDTTDIINNDNIVLMCYEKSSSFCHRHLVANWIKSYGINCKELFI